MPRFEVLNRRKPGGRDDKVASGRCETAESSSFLSSLREHGVVRPRVVLKPSANSRTQLAHRREHTRSVWEDGPAVRLINRRYLQVALVITLNREILRAEGIGYTHSGWSELMFGSWTVVNPN